MLAGQMTIFYCGKVNVYDDVPANKVSRGNLLIVNVTASVVLLTPLFWSLM